MTIEEVVRKVLLDLPPPACRSHAMAAGGHGCLNRRAGAECGRRERRDDAAGGRPCPIGAADSEPCYFATRPLAPEEFAPERGLRNGCCSPRSVCDGGSSARGGMTLNTTATGSTATSATLAATTN